LGAVGAGIYSVAFERYLIQENNYTMYFERLPEAFDGFKIAVLTDLHYGQLMPEFWVKSIINKCNALNTDVIVGVGDYVHKSNTDSELKTVWPILNTLKAKYGVFCVNGNHDHWANAKLAGRLLEESGFNVEHKPKVIKKGKQSIIISGVGDYTESKFLLDESLAKANQNTFKIVLAHNPDSVDLPHQTFTDLFISGHTHGGQVRIPFINYAPILPVKNRAYDCGIKHLKNAEQLFISKGIGWAILPIRFNTYPEIAILTLKNKVT